MTNIFDGLKRTSWRDCIMGTRKGNDRLRRFVDVKRSEEYDRDI